MPRARKGPARRRAKNRILKAAKGYRGARSKLYRSAKDAVRRARAYSYEHRRMKKRQFRRLWIVRINAACRERGLKYSEFMGFIKKRNIALNRQMLARLAVDAPAAFDRLVAQAKDAT